MEFLSKILYALIYIICKLYIHITSKEKGKGMILVFFILCAFLELNAICKSNTRGASQSEGCVLVRLHISDATSPSQK